MATGSQGVFIYFSQVLGHDVLGADNRLVGRIHDLVFSTREEAYPSATAVLISRGLVRKEWSAVGWEQVQAVDGVIRLRLDAVQVAFLPAAPSLDFCLRRDILDKQVVDTFNRKVIRVNDIHLLRVDCQLRLAHVDIGFRGLIRRLGVMGPVDLLVRIVMPRAHYLQHEDFIAWKFVQPLSVQPGQDRLRLTVARDQLYAIPAPDLGEMMLDLDLTQRVAFFRSLDLPTRVRITESLEIGQQKALLEELEMREVVELVGAMSPDEAADLLENYPRALANEVLGQVESTRAKKLGTLLGYASLSAGGLMTTDLLAFGEKDTVGTALDRIRARRTELDSLQHCYVVDEQGHLLGTTTLPRLIAAAPGDPVSAAMIKRPPHVHVGDGVRRVAYMMEKYRFSSLPVLDDRKVLQGVITVDDVLDVVIPIAWRRRVQAIGTPRP